MEKHEIREIFEDVLNERNRIDGETHRTHHDFVARWLERKAKRDERWEKVRTQVYGWSAIVLLGAIGKGVWELVQYVMDNIESHH